MKKWVVQLAVASGSLLLAAISTASPPEGLTADRPAGVKARVVIVEDHEATESFRPSAERMPAMIERAITNLTSKATSREAWLSLVSTQDVVGIKVYSVPGPNSGTRPAVASAIARG